MLERPELSLLQEKGYRFQDPFEVVELFEKRIAEYVGAPYGIAVDCATHALELSLRYLQATGAIHVPKQTYLSVPMTVQKLLCDVQWTDQSWQGHYQLNPYPVIDASVDFRKNSYQPGTFWCLSFQQKKTIPIGRGGMILVDDAKAAQWLIKASYDGRARGKQWKTDPIQVLGYHYYMTPEDAARGLLLLDALGDKPGKIGGSAEYPDISALEVFR